MRRGGVGLHRIAVDREEWGNKDEVARHPLPQAVQPVALDVIGLEDRVVARRCRLLVKNTRGRDVPALPSSQLPSNTQIHVLEIAKEIFVKVADLIQHRLAQRTSAAVRRQYFFGAVVLALVFFLPPSRTRDAVRIKEQANRVEEIRLARS